MGQYATIGERAIAEIIEKKSRFIGHIAHVETEDEALAFLAEIREQHRMARHNVYAYVLREGGRVRYSDDGEPQKTAGMPTLETIQYAGLSDVAVVVTRYFGGVLLGTGGLVRAYTQATQAAIQAARVVVMSRCVDIIAQLPYTFYDQALRLVNTCGAKVIDVSFSDLVALTVRVEAGKQGVYCERLAALTCGQAILTESDAFDAAM